MQINCIAVPLNIWVVVNVEDNSDRLLASLTHGIERIGSSVRTQDMPCLYTCIWKILMGIT